MNINVTVNNRQLSTDQTYRIPSGSLNDCNIAFNFEPGFGWDELDITAVFTRTEGHRAYRVGIKSGVYVAIPATIINTPGNIFISLMGCKNGNTVVTSLPVTLTVEHTALNVLNPDMYPLNEASEMDSDAYAQYVAAVNEAAVRAELAADKVSNCALGYYTKVESDARFAKRVQIQHEVDLVHKTDVCVVGDVPSVLINAVAPLNVIGSPSSPASLDSIESVRIDTATTDESSKSSLTYSGFTLRKLSDKVKDYLTVCKDGAFKTEKVYCLSLKNCIGKWFGLDYRVSLVTEPELDLGNSLHAINNVGNMGMTLTASSITLHFTTMPTEEELKAIDIWYPLANPIIHPVSATSMSAIPSIDATISVYKKVASEWSQLANWGILCELDVTRYLNKYNEELENLNNYGSQLADRINHVERKLASVASLKYLDISPEEWVPAEDGAYTVQVDNLGVVPNGCRKQRAAVVTALNPGVIPIDLRQLDPEIGFAESYACHVTDIDEDTVEIWAYGIMPTVPARFTYLSYK